MSRPAEAGVSARHRFSRDAGPERAHLRILATTDLHAHLWPWDYYADRPDQTVGLARIAAFAALKRAGAANAILLDNGDFLQGTPLGDHAALTRGEAHPVIAAMNAAGFDAGTIGNHEFNFGLDFLKAAAAGANFPLVSANLTDAAGAPVFPPWAILDRMVSDGAGAALPLRIGVIGVLPPQIMGWDARHLQGRAAARDIVEATEAAVPALRAAGADLVIALCHSGIGPAARARGMENAAIPLAAVPGIDALICGHSHRVFPGPDHAGRPGVDAAAGRIGAVPATAPGAFGSHLGIIDLLLDRRGGCWRVAAAESAAEPPPPGLAPDPAVIEASRAAHEATLAHVRRPAGRSLAPLHSYFAQVSDCPSVRIVAEAQAAYMRRMLEGTEWARLPILSAASPFKAGGRGGPDYYTDVSAGELALRNIADLYLYPNTVDALIVTGAEARNWLERSASMFLTVAPGAWDAPLIDPDFSPFNFDSLYGLTWEIDLAAPARFDREGAPLGGDGRIRRLRHEGRAVEPDARFVVVTNNYRAGGGGGFPGAAEDRVIFSGPDANRDILLAHVMAEGTIRPGGAPAWRFAPLPGATAIFESGPGSARHAAAVPGLRLEAAGRTKAGFLRWRIRL